MYLRKVEITNIRAIERFEMEFEEGKEAGWHVLLGENGSGKSTIARCISAALIGPEDIGHVRPNWEEWLAVGKDEGRIELSLISNPMWDQRFSLVPIKDLSLVFTNEFLFRRDGRVKLETNANTEKPRPLNWDWSGGLGWFSAGYGPFRRLSGGDPSEMRPFLSAPRAGAHLSMFGESIALTEALAWLKELDRKRLKENEQAEAYKQDLVPDSGEAGRTLAYVKRFINSSQLLPSGAHFKGIDIDGNPLFKDGFGNEILTSQLSDGFRSMLSLVFELLRQVFNQYSHFLIGPLPTELDLLIDIPGVVIIDEIDVHLHPTWQTEIGQWFTRFFPNIQFIVTTHSPLICRAAEKGSIWKLAAPGSDEPSGRITGDEYLRLVYGNVLDAYSTEAFGRDTSQSKAGQELAAELAALSLKSYKGKITPAEKKRMEDIRAILPTAQS